MGFRIPDLHGVQGSGFRVVEFRGEQVWKATAEGRNARKFGLAHCRRFGEVTLVSCYWPGH